MSCKSIQNSVYHTLEQKHQIAFLLVPFIDPLSSERDMTRAGKLWTDSDMMAVLSQITSPSHSQTFDTRDYILARVR